MTRSASPAGHVLNRIGQRQFPLLGELVSTEVGSAFDLSLDLDIETGGGPLALGPLLTRNWLADRMSPEQRTLLSDVIRTWREAERAAPLWIPGLNRPFADLTKVVPVCLDLSVHFPDGAWFINLLSRDTFVVSDEAARAGQPTAGEERTVIVFGHITRALRLGGLTQLMTTLQDAGALTASVRHAVNSKERSDIVAVERQPKVLAGINADFSFSGRSYTALSRLRWCATAATSGPDRRGSGAGEE